MPSAAHLAVGPLSRLCKALGDETRVRILALLAHGELCVCHVEAALGLSQPAASRHLAVLRTAGVVEARRQGSWVYYRLARQQDDRTRRVLQALSRSFAREETRRRDYERLVRATGPGACP